MASKFSVTDVQDEVTPASQSEVDGSESESHCVSVLCDWRKLQSYRLETTVSPSLQLRLASCQIQSKWPLRDAQKSNRLTHSLPSYPMTALREPLTKSHVKAMTVKQETWPCTRQVCYTRTTRTPGPSLCALYVCMCLRIVYSCPVIWHCV